MNGYPDGMTQAMHDREMGCGPRRGPSSIDMDPVDRAALARQAAAANAAIAAAEVQARADLTTWDAATRDRVLHWLSTDGGEAVALIAHAMMCEATEHRDGRESCAWQWAKNLRDDYIQYRAHLIAGAA